MDKSRDILINHPGRSSHRADGGMIAGTRACAVAVIRRGRRVTHFTQSRPKRDQFLGPTRRFESRTARIELDKLRTRIPIRLPNVNRCHETRVYSDGVPTIEMDCHFAKITLR